MDSFGISVWLGRITDKVNGQNHHRFRRDRWIDQSLSKFAPVRPEVIANSPISSAVVSFIDRSDAAPSQLFMSTNKYESQYYNSETRHAELF